MKFIFAFSVWLLVASIHHGNAEEEKGSDENSNESPEILQCEPDCEDNSVCISGQCESEENVKMCEESLNAKVVYILRVKNPCYLICFDEGNELAVIEEKDCQPEDHPAHPRVKRHSKNHGGGGGGKSNNQHHGGGGGGHSSNHHHHG